MRRGLGNRWKVFVVGGALLAGAIVGTVVFREGGNPHVEPDLARAAGLPAPEWQTHVENAVGTSDTSRYLRLDHRSTADAPYGPLTGGGTLAGLPDPRTVVRSAGAALHVEVVDISPPHFNSADGGFWVIDETSGGPGLGIIQDVSVHVVDEWGDRLGLPDDIVLSVFGGAIEVTFDEEQARAAEQPGAGTYIYSFEPDVRLEEGERALLFVARDPIPYKEGPREALRVLGGFQGKFVLETGNARNERAGWKVPVAELRSLVARELHTDPDYEN